MYHEFHATMLAVVVNVGVLSDVVDRFVYSIPQMAEEPG